MIISSCETQDQPYRLEKGWAVPYGIGMSSRSLCISPGCTHRRFAETEFCLLHAKDSLALQQEYIDRIISETVLRDLSLPGISLDGIDFSHKTLMNCDFHAAILRNCTFMDTNMTFCLFDHARFETNTVRESKFLESIFACSWLGTMEFLGSDIIQCNFNGCELGNSKFIGDDLMYSRFLEIKSQDLLFEDCNLKAVYFSSQGSEQIGFQYSNKEDAFFL